MIRTEKELRAMLKKLEKRREMVRYYASPHIRWQGIGAQIKALEYALGEKEDIV